MVLSITMGLSAQLSSQGIFKAYTVCFSLNTWGKKSVLVKIVYQCLNRVVYNSWCVVNFKIRLKDET